MKILIVTGYYPSSNKPSEGTFLHRRAVQLASSGCDVDIFLVKVVTPATFIRSPDDVLDFVRTPRLFSYTWKAQLVQGVCAFLPIPGSVISRSQSRCLYRAIRPEIDRMFQAAPYDCILLTGGGPLAEAVGRYAAENHLPYVVYATGWNIDSWPSKPETYAYRRERRMFLASKLVVCVSQEMALQVRQMTDGKVETFVFRSGVDTEVFEPDASLRSEFRTKLGYEAEETVLCFVGHVMRAKGVYELLRVLDRLADQRPGLRLLLVGALVEGRRIRKAVQELGIGTMVTTTGGVDHENIAGYLNASDLFVFPSWHEGLPNAVMEAAACQLPIVASAVGGILELIDDGRSGLLVPPRHEGALFDVITGLLDAPRQRRDAMGKVARERMVQEFNYSRNGKVLAERLEAVLQN